MLSQDSFDLSTEVQYLHSSNQLPISTVLSNDVIMIELPHRLTEVTHTLSITTCDDHEHIELKSDQRPTKNALDRIA